MCNVHVCVHALSQVPMVCARIWFVRQRESLRCREMSGGLCVAAGLGSVTCAAELPVPKASILQPIQAGPIHV